MKTNVSVAFLLTSGLYSASKYISIPFAAKRVKVCSAAVHCNNNAYLPNVFQIRSNLPVSANKSILVSCPGYDLEFIPVKGSMMDLTQPVASSSYTFEVLDKDDAVINFATTNVYVSLNLEFSD